jgi:hypothetical protein
MVVVLLQRSGLFKGRLSCAQSAHISDKWSQLTNHLAV